MNRFLSRTNYFILFFISVMIIFSSCNRNNETDINNPYYNTTEAPSECPIIETNPPGTFSDVSLLPPKENGEDVAQSFLVEKTLERVDNYYEPVFLAIRRNDDWNILLVKYREEGLKVSSIQDNVMEIIELEATNDEMMRLMSENQLVARIKAKRCFFAEESMYVSSAVRTLLLNNNDDIINETASLSNGMVVAYILDDSGLSRFVMGEKAMEEAEEIITIWFERYLG